MEIQVIHLLEHILKKLVKQVLFTKHMVRGYHIEISNQWLQIHWFLLKIERILGSKRLRIFSIVTSKVSSSAYYLYSSCYCLSWTLGNWRLTWRFESFRVFIRISLSGYHCLLFKKWNLHSLEEATCCFERLLHLISEGLTIAGQTSFSCEGWLPLHLTHFQAEVHL